MANVIDTLTISERISMNGKIGNSTQSVSQTVSPGSTVLPTLTVTWGFGNGTNQLDSWFADYRTLAAGSTDNIDLAGGITNAILGNFSFATVKRVLIAVDTPSANVTLRVGPQGNAAACPLWFGNTTLTTYATVTQKLDIDEPLVGWTVTPTTADILPIKNAGNLTATYGIWIFGIKV